MTQPLIVLLYERLLPGGQLMNRLPDLGYRVRVIADPGQLVEECEREKPLLVIADLEVGTARVCQALSQLRRQEATAHIPVLAYAAAESQNNLDAGRAAGATLATNDAAIQVHLDQLLDQALQLE